MGPALAVSNCSGTDVTCLQGLVLEVRGGGRAPGMGHKVPQVSWFGSANCLPLLSVPYLLRVEHGLGGGFPIDCPHPPKVGQDFVSNSPHPLKVGQGCAPNSPHPLKVGRARPSLDILGGGGSRSFWDRGPGPLIG